VSLASRLTGPAYLGLTAKWLEIDDLILAPAASVPSGYQSFYLIGCSGLVYINQCQIEGAGGTTLPIGFDGQQEVYVVDCLFRECSNGVYAFNKATINLQDNCFINCSGPIVGLFANINAADWNTLHSRNSTNLISARYHTHVDCLTFSFHMVGGGTAFYIGDDSSTFQEAVYEAHVVDGQAPSCYVELSGPNCKATFRDTFTDASLPTAGSPGNKPIRVWAGGTTPQVAMTWNEFHGIYLHHYVFGNGVEVIGHD
jgi:hypothetical protein